VNSKIYQGPRYGHFFIMPEDNLIHLYEGTELAYINGRLADAPPLLESEFGERMVMIYPKEGSMPRNNCACIVQADWVSAEQVEAARVWIDYLLEDEQQRSFLAQGFRPGTDLSLDDPVSKITSEYGLDPDVPAKVITPALIQPAVAAAIDQSWELVKRPAVVTFAVDTSVSMKGAKYDQVITGFEKALKNMSPNNQIGLVTFGSTASVGAGIEALTQDHKFNLDEAVRNASIEGEGALFDALKLAISMTDEAPAADGAIRAVVALTDGRVSNSQTRLDELITMMTWQEAPVRWSGSFGTVPTDLAGNVVAPENVIGVKLTLRTTHPVQVFWIGIGDDPDIQVGRLLAEATGAEFEATTNDAFERLIEEIGIYF
jgi:hypothetical protein